MLNTLYLVTFLDFGCYKDNQNNELDFFKIPSFTNEEKDPFFNKIIQSKDKDIGSFLDSFFNRIQKNTLTILIEILIKKLKKY